MIAFLFRLIFTVLSHWVSESEDESFDLKICRTINLIRKFSQLAGHFWLMNEGIHLYLLLKNERPKFNKKLRNRLIKGYLFIGWGVPFTIMAFYCYFRDKLEKPATHELKHRIECFLNTHPIDYLIRYPIIFCIMITFILFFSIIGTIWSKYKSHDQMEEADLFRNSSIFSMFSSNSDRKNSVTIALQTFRNSTTSSMQSMRTANFLSKSEYWKFIRATLFLMVLLGIHH